MIPERLKNPEFRFIKLRKREKIPIEKAWQSKKNYSFDDSALIEWLAEGGNCGIIGGYGGLLVVDFDDLSLYESMIPRLPDTFMVKTGSGKYHVYFLCDDTASCKAGSGKIDVQGKGKQVVVPGSIHPNGEPYEVFKDVPIARIERSVLNSILDPKKEELKQEKPVEQKSVDDSRSGKEWGRVLALLKEGYDKEQVFSLMEQKRKVKDAEGKVKEEFIWQKWNVDGEHYREATYKSALRQYSEERDAKIPFLKRPDLLDAIDAELDKQIVDEKDTRKAVLLVALGGSLTINCAPTSTNLMVNDASGAGKDFVCKSVLDILPKYKVVARKRISERVFTYWHNAKFEPEWSWDGKIFYNEDIGNSLLNCDVFKVMSSSDGVNQSTIIIKQQLVEIITKGKPVMLITLAHAYPKDELLRRYPICNLDTTEDQTRKIIKRKAEFAKSGMMPRYSAEVKDALAYLQRVKVRIPFADKLSGALDTSHIIIRTHFDRFLDYIRFSCALHQFQRKEEDGHLLAERQDYELACRVLRKTTSNVFCVPLTKNQQRILELLRSLVEGVWYSVSDLEPSVTFVSDRTLYKELDKLTEFGFLSKDKQKRERADKPVMVYRLNKISQLGLPSWADIQNASNTHIDSISSGSSNSSNSSNGSNGRPFEVNEPFVKHIDNEKLSVEEEKID